MHSMPQQDRKRSKPEQIGAPRFQFGSNVTESCNYLQPQKECHDTWNKAEKKPHDRLDNYISAEYNLYYWQKNKCTHVKTCASVNQLESEINELWVLT
jgi:hypothetical protein